MTDERDLRRLLDAWFADGPTGVADRVIDDVAVRIVRQPQRPAWRLRSWRFPTMSSPLKLVLIGAALLAALVTSTVFLSGGGPSPAPTPSPTPFPSPTPTATIAPSPPVAAVYPAWFTGDRNGAGILPAGTNTTRRFMRGSTFTVPADWVNDGDHDILYSLFPDNPVNRAAYGVSRETAQNMLVTDRVANNMFAICDATGLFQGTTASEIVSGIVANKALAVTQPVAVTIGGLRGRQVDVRISPKWKGTCALNPDEPPTTDYLDDRNRVIVLDKPVTGMIGFSIGSARSSDFEAFLADAMPIVESFQFDFGIGPSPRP